MSAAESCIDIEAQRPLLVRTNTSPRRIWTQLILLYTSSSIFLSATNNGDEPSAVVDPHPSLSATYNTSGDSTSNVEDDGDQYSESIEIADNSPAAPPDHQLQCSFEITEDTSEVHNNDGLENMGASSNVQSTAPNTAGYNAIELQLYQLKNIKKIVKEKNLQSIRDFGGVEGLAYALGSDLENGFCGDPNTCQQHMTKIDFQNQVPAKVSFVPFLVVALKSSSIILLSIAAVLSITFGMIDEGPSFGWVNGVTIITTIVVLVAVSSYRKYYLGLKSREVYSAEQEFLKDYKELEVCVTREGREQQINICELLCGDIVSLKRGYHIPADGLFIGCGSETLEVMDDGVKFIIDEQNPFLLYGSRVIRGNGRMIATSVGRDTLWSELMSQASSTVDSKKSNFETQLDKFSNCTNNFNLLIIILIFIATFLRFSISRLHDGIGYKSDSKAELTALKMIVNSLDKIIIESKVTSGTLIILLSVSLVGLMEGIPFVVSIAIIFWNNSMLADHKATGRDLLACIKMASVTFICTDKIGGLTEHHAEVVKLLVGEEVVSESRMLSQQVLDSLEKGIFRKSVLESHNSGCSLDESLISWANHIFDLRTTNVERSRSTLPGTEHDHSVNFSGILLEREVDFHCNGTLDQVLPKCSRYYNRRGELKKLDSQKKKEFKLAYGVVANELKTIVFACKNTPEQELEATNDLILVGLLGLKITSREATKAAITGVSKEGGVKTILVSADDVSSLKKIALEYEILGGNSDHLVLTGEEFRNLDEIGRMEKVDRIRVLGNCLPSDKLLLVKCLRKKRNTVAMVGWRRSDSPALKEADIGVAMGTWSTKEARENSDLIIRDGGNEFLVDMIECSRCAHGKVQKFIQVQLIMITSSSLINFIAVTSMGDAPMKTIQLFVLNLVMAFVGGMALLTGPLTGKPMSAAEPLITKAMTRNVVAQVLYQITTLVTLQQKGHEILGITKESTQFMIFNSFILCQFFNLVIARELQHKNFFSGIFRDCWFGVAVAIYVLLHMAFVLTEHRVDSSTDLNWKLWAACFVIGILSWIVDWVVKCALQLKERLHYWSLLIGYEHMSYPISTTHSFSSSAD